MDSPYEMTISVTRQELSLLLEGLGAYEYWQLGDVLPRNDGQVFLPDDPYANRFWAADQLPTADQREAIGGVRRCRDLAARLGEARIAQGEQGVRGRLERTRDAHAKAVDALVPALIATALTEIVEVLPGATSLEVLGETNEDGLDTLRIQRVRDADGGLLYDIDTGHPDRAVEDRIDYIGSEYLDLVLDVTYGTYFGRSVLELA